MFSKLVKKFIHKRLYVLTDANDANDANHMKAILITAFNHQAIDLVRNCKDCNKHDEFEEQTFIENGIRVVQPGDPYSKDISEAMLNIVAQDSDLNLSKKSLTVLSLLFIDDYTTRETARHFRSK